jgi:hypothetical protein
LTFDKLYSILVGQCKINDDIFWNLTFRDATNIIDGFYELEQLRQQQEWERTRWLAAVMLSPHAKKGKTIKPTDLIKFDWEKKAKKAKKKRDKAFWDKVDQLHFKEKQKREDGNNR